MRTVKIKATDLIEDFNLYPRVDVDSGHVAQIVEAIEARAFLPPIIAEKKSKRIIDGFHRRRAWLRHAGNDVELEVELREYDSESEMFLEAIRLNAQHGRNLTSYDKTHAIERALRFEIDPSAVASALNLRVEKVTSFRTQRCAKIENTKRLAPLKLPIRHLAGTIITKEQSEIIPKLGGNQQLFYVNQLLMLIDSGMIDHQNEKLKRGLVKLSDKLMEFLGKAQAA